MSTLRVTLTVLALALGAAMPASAQEVRGPTQQSAPKLARKKFSGPRFGFTAFTGDVAEKRQNAGLEPIMSQFGWQFETQIVSANSGNQALMEWVFLVGGVEQDELNLSLAWLAGYRTAGGLELGVGPNMSVTKNNIDPTTSMVVAGGATLPFGDIFIPVHMAVAAARGGPRFTALVGWIVN